MQLDKLSTAVASNIPIAGCLWLYITRGLLTTLGHPVEYYRHQLGSYGVSGELALRPVASLSGGQKSRLAFALMAAKRFVKSLAIARVG